MFFKQVLRQVQVSKRLQCLSHVGRFIHSYKGSQARQLSSKLYLQVIGTLSRHTAPSVLLFTDSERYLFNCGENFAQLIYYLDLPFDAGKVFLTGGHWKHIGGLAGLHFVPQTTDPYGVHIFGLHGIKDFMKSTSMFTRTNRAPESLITCTEYSDITQNTYSDNNVTIKPVIYPTTSDKSHQTSISYICEIGDLRGSFIPKKAEELNIPYGYWRNELHSGKSVTLPDGRTIYPHQVVLPAQPGPLFAIVECMTTATMDALTNCNNFSNHFHYNYTSKNFELIVHMTTQSLIETAEYQQWMDAFGPNTSHIILSEETAACQRHSNIRNRLDLRLCNIDPVLFPIALDKEKLSSSRLKLPKNCIEGESGLEYHFYPYKKKGINKKNIYKPNFKRKFGDNLEKGNMEWSSHFNHLSEGQKKDYYNTSVTFLGTAASKQSKMRATSSILVELSSKCCFMLDCGDGTNYQLQRHYGDDDIDRILSSLSFVFISHIHMDHHMGLVNLILNHVKLKKQGKVSKELLIIGPESLLHWLKQCSSLITTELSYRYYTFTDIKSGNLKTEMKDLLTSLNLRKLSIVPVYHCFDSHGIVLTHNAEWKLVYSGDCAPSETLWKEGHDATLLIHEATFLPDYKKTDKVKHSTFDEAIEVSKKMRARYTILTHFSQRYTLSDLLTTPLPPGVSLAFDHMSVHLVDLPDLEKRQSRIRRILSKKNERHK